MHYTSLLDPNEKTLFADPVILSLDIKSPIDVSHSALAHILSMTTTYFLQKRERAIPLWFVASKNTLRDYIDRRNTTFNGSQKYPNPLNMMNYISSRHNVQLQVRKGKSQWIINKCNFMNDGFNGTTCGKSPWDVVNLFEVRINTFTSSSTHEVKTHKWLSCYNTKRSSKYFLLLILYSLWPPPYSWPFGLTLLMQAICFTNLDATPYDEENLEAVREINASSPGSSGLHARLWQALSSIGNGFHFIRHSVIQFWIP